MSGQLWFVLGVGVLAGLGAGVPLGLWRGRRVGLGDYEDGYEDGYRDAHEARDEWDRGREARLGGLVTIEYEPVRNDSGGLDWRERTAVELAPEALALADVPEPAPGGPPTGHGSDAALTTASEPWLINNGHGLGHPSPYTGTPTPAQRRRDKHKQRGPYARPLSAGELDPDAPWCPGCGFANYSASPCEVCGYDDQNPPAPGDLPDPPTDVGAWWQAELDALLEDGQSEWLTRNLAGAA